MVWGLGGLLLWYGPCSCSISVEISDDTDIVLGSLLPMRVAGDLGGLPPRYGPTAARCHGVML